MVRGLILHSAEGTLKHKKISKSFKIAFFNSRNIDFCVISSGKCFFSLDLHDILLRLLIMTSHNINSFALTKYFIVIHFLLHQSALKLDLVPSRH